jgi:phosphoenolpyruvate carboxykinase (ATP)
MYHGPTDVFFLSCDAYGILPPVSKLSYEDARYHFLSGYTAKVAGTELGVKEPQATFSACFGLPFMILKPQVYATLLKQRLEQTKVNVWLINTGWIGGSYGTGTRISLKYTRRIIQSILKKNTESFVYKRDSNFKLDRVIQMDGIHENILNQEQAWTNSSSYQETYDFLHNLFKQNIRL